MRIIQLLPTLVYGDAIGNDVIALKKAIENMGCEALVYAEYVAPALENKVGFNITKMPQLREDDIILYHLSTGTQINYDLPGYKCKKVVIYHNVTPAHFFKGYDAYVEGVVRQGLEGVKYLADKVDYCLAVSEFDKQDLIKCGYQMPIDVLPILIPFDDYKKEPDREICNKYRDGKHNIIFTGRVAPNKCHQDIIAAFDCYKKNYDPEARLFLVGSYDAGGTYFKKLKEYIKHLKVEDVFFTGHISFNEILAYYRVADVFICMSEHEGFCVPLVESMFFEVPIIAYNCTAIPDTLGDGGILIDKKDPLETAALINRLIIDTALRKRIQLNQKKRLEDFRYEKIEGMFKSYMSRFVDSIM